MSLVELLAGFFMALSGSLAYGKLLAAPLADAKPASVLEFANAVAENYTATPCREKCVETFRICGANMTYSFCRRQMMKKADVFQSGVCPNPWCMSDASMRRMEGRERPHHSDSWPPHRPTLPTLCTAENKGRCDCAMTDVPDHEGKLLRTFTWWYAGQQRCFTEYVPPPGSSGEYQPRSVLLNLQCNANDRLDGVGFKSGSDLMDGADRFNFIAIGLSTPNIGAWDFGHGGVVNDKLPQPCSATYSDDIVYVRDVLKHLRRNHRIHDGRKIFLKGFSQNSMFAAFSAYCFPAEIAGLWQVSSGLAVKGLLPVPPRKESVCSRWAYDTYGDACDEEAKCESCKYFPIYPCHFRRPMVHCLSFYSNDQETASDPTDPNSTATLADNMFNIAAKEGHDVRLLRFQPQGNHIAGGHQPPGNGFDWLVGCLGMAPRCSQQCAAALAKCMVGVRSERRRVYNRCLVTDLVASGVCNRGCAPTKDMLFHLERPSLRLSKGSFGEPPGGHHYQWNLSQPEQSICSHVNSSYVTTRPSLQMRVARASFLHFGGEDEEDWLDFEHHSEVEWTHDESQFTLARKSASSKRESADAHHRVAHAWENHHHHPGSEHEAKAHDAHRRYGHWREDSRSKNGTQDAHQRPQHSGSEEAEEARRLLKGDGWPWLPGDAQEPEELRRFLAFEGEDSVQQSGHEREADDLRNRFPYTASSSVQKVLSERKAEDERHNHAYKDLFPKGHPRKFFSVLQPH